MTISIHPNVTMNKYHDGNGPLPFSWTAESAAEELRKRLPDTPIELLTEEQIANGDATHVSYLLAGKVSAEILDHMPNVRWVQFTGSGKDHFYAASGLSPEEFDRRGVTVLNSPGVNSNAVAEHAVALILALARGIPRSIRQQIEHKWEIFSGFEVLGKSVTVIGLGRVGERVAELCRNIGLRVTAVKRDPNTHAGNAHRVVGVDQFPQVIESADFVVVCAPYDPKHGAMFTYETFQRMKKGSYFVNVSRGLNVNEADLYRALTDGTIAGAGIDNHGYGRDLSDMRSEPKLQEALRPESPLWDCTNLLMTPNNASAGDHFMANFADCVTASYLRIRGQNHDNV